MQLISLSRTENNMEKKLDIRAKTFSSCTKTPLASNIPQERERKIWEVEHEVRRWIGPNLDFLYKFNVVYFRAVYSSI
jgi:hypothetical protein